MSGHGSDVPHASGNMTLPSWPQATFLSQMTISRND